MAHPIDRRTFLRRGVRGAAGAAALGLTGPALLEACSSSGGGGKYGKLNFVGPWIPDVETAGEYLADSKGYWKSQGFGSVNIIPSGPNATPQETMVQTGKGLVAIISLDSTAAAIQKQNFGIVVIGLQYQVNPFCIMSPASAPLNNAQDMIGKKIGVQSVNFAVWDAFLKANNIDPSKVNKVTVGFDPTPLTQGAVDGWFSFITNEPILLKLQKNFDTKTFLLADNNYPEGGNAYITQKKSLTGSTRNKVKAAMIGDIMGWKEALTNPTEAATVTVPKTQGLTQQQELLQAEAQNKLIATGDALTNGLFYATPTFQAANIKTLGLGGTTVTASQLFDMSLLDEIYADASLKAVPTPVTS